MRRALDVARRGWGTAHPNPMVGALIVEDGKVVAEGHHAVAGQEHAEVAALRELGRTPAPGAILVVTLEPCSTQGRTGPCIPRILEAGIRHVIAGAEDPNPAHAGRGFTLLREHGVRVESGVLKEACGDLNLIFNHWITRQTTLLAAKLAVTLDGKSACRSGVSQWITGEAARADVMRWRRLFPAIAVGAGTVIKDNPRLTSRAAGEEWCPIRFVFDGYLRTVMDRFTPKVYDDEFRDRTIVVTSSHAGSGYVRKLESLGVRVWTFPSVTPRVVFGDFRRRCVEEGVVGVYVEGGPRLVSEMLQTRELDYLFAYTAPLLFADDRALSVFRGLRTEKMEQAVRLDDVRHEVFGSDVLTRGRMTYPGKLNVDETALGNQ